MTHDKSSNVPIMTTNSRTKRYRTFIAANHIVHEAIVDTPVCMTVMVNEDKEEAVSKESTVVDGKMPTIQEDGTHASKCKSDYCNT